MPSAQNSFGRDTVRVDGPLKVSGRAQYTSDFHFPGMLYAVPVGATIANGKLAGIDVGVAEKCLDRAEVSAVIKEVGGVAVAEGVGSGVDGEAGHRRVVADGAFD